MNLPNMQADKSVLVPDARQHLAVSIASPQNDLIAAECEALTGVRPNGNRLAFCSRIDQISQAAYTRYGATRIVETTSLDGLVQWLLETEYSAPEFRIQVLNFSAQESRSSLALIIALADAIDSEPNLDHPRHKLLLVVEEKSYWFGEIEVETNQGYRQHDAKPQRISTSLPPRLARALVNLAAAEGELMINPCCGSGSLLLEAGAIGLSAIGADWNPTMVRIAQQNVAYFGYDVPIDLVDVRQWAQTADVLIADFPYGKYLAWKETVMLELLQQAVSLAPVAIYVAAVDITPWLIKAGYRDIELLRVSKVAAFTRYIHRARSDITHSLS
ncbi:MAG: hypothetical protein AAF629_11580 [Chloroflexota bacterium]